MAVSTATRYQVLERANSVSELSGVKGRPLQCCHLSHQRDFHYNTPEVVVLCTDIEHLAYHLLFERRSKEVGLPERHNYRAINTLWATIVQFNCRNGIPDDFESIGREVERAKDFWYYYLGIEP